MENIPGEADNYLMAVTLSRDVASVVVPLSE